MSPFCGEDYKKFSVFNEKCEISYHCQTGQQHPWSKKNKISFIIRKQYIKVG